jgi:hypothetical protein
MNTAGRFTMGAGALAVALALGFSAGESQAAKPAAPVAGGVAGKVTFLKGVAQRGSVDKGPFKPLKRNDDVKEGEFLKTGADSRVEVKLADGSLVRLAPNSTLRLGTAKAGEGADTEKGQSKLTAGKMWASVTKAVGGESKFAVRTENAVAGVRGTTFRVNAEEDGSTVVKVYEGAVAVSNGPLVEKKKAAGDKGPVDFQGRKEIAPPFKEVSLQEWEKIVGKMMSIKVAVNGDQAEPEQFTAQNDAKDTADQEWVAWNQEMDKAGGRDVPQ